MDKFPVCQPRLSSGGDLLSTAVSPAGYGAESHPVRNFQIMIDPRLQSLANKIKVLVEASPYKAVEIASLMGKDKSAVSRWISGERTPTMQNLIELADLLDIDMRELWTGEEAMPATSEQRLMMDLMKGMTIEQQQAWLAATAAAFRKGA